MTICSRKEPFRLKFWPIDRPFAVANLKQEFGSNPAIFQPYIKFHSISGFKERPIDVILYSPGLNLMVLMRHSFALFLKVEFFSLKSHFAIRFSWFWRSERPRKQQRSYWFILTYLSISMSSSLANFLIANGSYWETKKASLFWTKINPCKTCLYNLPRTYLLH